MKKNHKSWMLALILFLATIQTAAWGQDQRTVTTKVADLLAQMPSQNMERCDRLMSEMSAWGEAGWTLVTSQIIPPGTGNDVAARFAVESLSRYLSRSGHEAARPLWEKQCLSALEKTENVWVKSFFLEQLRWVGSASCLGVLEQYLTHPQLYDPAIRAMLQGDASLAVPKFAAALDRADGKTRVALVVALKQAGTASEAGKVEALAGSADRALQKAILAALATMGNPSSAQILQKAAEQANYQYEPLGATEALLDFAQTLSQNQRKDLSHTICEKVMKNCTSADQMQYKSKALSVLVADSSLPSATSLLLKAASDTDKKYRAAALSLALRQGGPIQPWIDALSKSNNGEAQADLVHFLAVRKDPAATPALKKMLSHRDPRVRTEAAEALAIVEKEKAFNDLLAYLAKYPSSPDADAIQKALLMICSTQQARQLAEKVKEAPDGAKVVMLEVIAAKNDPQFFPIFQSNIQGSPRVRETAVNNLAAVAGGGNLDFLLNMIEGPLSEKEIQPVQKSLATAVRRSENNDAAAEKILQAARKSSSPERYFAVLAGIGSEVGVEVALQQYRAGSSVTKPAALDALVQWKNGHSAGALFEICSGDNSVADKQKAFDGFVDTVEMSKALDDQKLLQLRKIMPFAPNDESRKRLLSSLGNIKTFLSFMYICSFFENEALRSTAANSAVSVALPDPGKENGLYGKIVKEKLLRAKELITGQDAPYIKIDIETYLGKMKEGEGFVSMFNGRDLAGWQGFVTDPIKKAQMDPEELSRKQAEANAKLKDCWTVKDGAIVFNGKGENLLSAKNYGDFELWVDWRITANGDSGIYLRGSPQVQIWDPARVDAGAQVGSGGLYNNQKNPSNPLVRADNPVEEWNTFRILMIGDRVTVYLNGKLVVDHVVLENYWDRGIPIFSSGTIELQAHGTDLAFRDIYIREINSAEQKLTAIEQKESFVSLFNGYNLDGWVGNKTAYQAEDGLIVIRPSEDSGGNLYTEKEYGNFVFRFDFQLTPAANNGVGIRTPLEGDAAYVGMEIQVLDDTAPVYADLKPYQYHGSVYGVIPAKRGFLKPLGEWNSEEISAQGSRMKVILNGEVILDGDISEARDHGTLDHNQHPGLQRESGHIGWLGHGSVVKFRNIRIKELP